MSVYLELSKSQVKTILTEYIAEIDNTLEFEKFVKHIIHKAKYWEEFDWTAIEKIVSKMYKRQKQLEGE